MGQNRSCIVFIEQMDDAVGKYLLGALEDVNDRRLGVNCGGCSSSRVELIRDVRVSVFLKITYYSRHRLIGSLIMQLMGSNLTRFSSPKLLL
jgi:hypothetical protein